MKTFGTIAFKKGKWRIEAEPHVEIILKRCFPRLGKKQHGVLLITDTPEVARDLQWFCKRYPFKAKDAFTATYLNQEAQKHKDTEALVDELLSGVRKTGDFETAIPGRDYQKVAAELVLAKGGLLLADVVGVGKSYVGIAIATKEHCRPALVVTMTHLCRQWEAEFKKFAPNLNVHVVNKGTPYDLTKPKRAKPGQMALTVTRETPDVIIINYHKLAGWSATLGRICRSATWDECAELRRTESQKYKAAEHIAGNMKVNLGCSATPIFNYGDEIWNVMNITSPGALGSRSEFLETWCKGLNMRGQAALKDPNAFGSYARAAGLMLRRTRKDIARELPDITNVVQLVDSDSEELEKIQSPAAELARRILATGPSIKGEKFRDAGQLDGLVRQATGLAKAVYCAEFVKMLIESGEPVVLFGWHHAVYQIWMEKLKEFDPVLYTGKESTVQKDEAKRKFVSGESKLLIMSLRSGLGLNDLQNVCHVAAFGELDWSPAIFDQCVGRLHRDGQSEGVIAYYLISAEGSDPIMSDVLGIKKQQADGLKNPEGEAAVLQDIGGQHVRKLAEHYLALSQRREAAQ